MIIKEVFRIQKRKLKDSGSLVTKYDVLRSDGIYNSGEFLGTEILCRCNTKKEAIAYCKEHNIVILGG